LRIPIVKGERMLRSWVFGLALVTGLLLTRSVEAQAIPGGSQPALASAVRVGESIKLKARGGETVRGTVVAIDPGALTLKVRGRSRAAGTDQRRFDEADITRISTRDLLVNGLLIGAGAGVVGTWALVRSQCGPAGFDPECTANAVAVTWPYIIAAGTAIGGFIDAAVWSKTVYVRRDPRVSLAVGPAAAAGHPGVSLALRF
jgi:hypothetical protein